MTEHARQFITGLSLRSMSHSPVVRDQFERPTSRDVKHISLARRADLMLIALCTANIIGKLASGVAGDMPATTALAAIVPIVIAPAMNDRRYGSRIVQCSLGILREAGFIIASPPPACWPTAAPAGARWPVWMRWWSW